MRITIHTRRTEIECCEALQSAVAEWMGKGKHRSVDKADKTIALDNYAATPILFQGVKL